MFGLNPLATRVIGGIVIALALLALILTLGYCQSRREAATARATGEVATGQANAAKGAVETLDGQMRAETVNRDTEARNRQDILNAENAKNAAGDAGNRGIRALCDRLLYKSDPRCVELQRANRPDAP